MTYLWIFIAFVWLQLTLGLTMGLKQHPRFEDANKYKVFFTVLFLLPLLLACYISRLVNDDN